MKLKRKSLALMVSITCSGLLYGANANAEAVTGFGDNTADTAFTAITDVLKAGSLEANDNSLTANANTTKAHKSNCGRGATRKTRQGDWLCCIQGSGDERQ